MKIWYLTNYYYPEVTAGATRAYEQVQILKENGFEVSVITGFPNYPTGKIYSGYKNKCLSCEVIDGVNVYRNGHTIARNDKKWLRIFQYVSFVLITFINTLTKLKSQIEKDDIIYVSSGPIFVPMISWMISKLLSCPYIIEFRDITFIQMIAVHGKSTTSSRVIKKIELFLANSAEKIVVSTISFKKALTKYGVSEDNITVAYNGFIDDSDKTVKDNEEELSRIKSEIDEQKLIFMYIGTLGISQCVDEIISRVEEIKLLDKQLIIIGDGAAKGNVLDEINNANYKVSYWPSVSRNVARKLYEISDIQIVKLKDNPQFGYFMPSKVFEIGIAGKPILYFGPKGEVSNLIGKTNGGFAGISDPRFLELTNDRSHVELKDKLVAIGDSNRIYIKKHFNRRENMKGLIGFLNDIKKD